MCLISASFALVLFQLCVRALIFQVLIDGEVRRDTEFCKPILSFRNRSINQEMRKPKKGGQFETFNDEHSPRVGAAEPAC